MRTNQVEIQRYQDGKWCTVEDLVVKEVPVTIYVNGEELVTLLATPEYLDELAVGHLRAEGFLHTREDLAGVEVDPQGNWVQVTTTKDFDRGLKLYGRRMLTSGCGRGTVFYNSLDALDLRPVEGNSAVYPENIGRLIRQMEDASVLFQDTGGVHGAGLATTTGELLLFREDIGRHNAVDKISGYSLQKNLDTGDKILATSGRISSEIVQKIGKLGVPVLVSPSAPTELAVAVAQRLNLTLVGFARGGRMNVYSGSERLI